MMNHLRRGNKDLIKELNRAFVIDQIRLNGPISRTDIAKNTDLGLSTITNIIDELEKENLVQEFGAGSSNGGRKPVLLKLNGDSGLVIGVKIEKNKLIFCSSNLNAKIVSKSQVLFHHVDSSKDITSLIIQEIENILANVNKETRFYGIGIATSGLVDRDNKKVIHSPILSWENVDFSPIGDYFNIPVFIDNDANVFSLAQMWIGLGKEYDNFIGVTIGAGVGAGIVIDKKIYRGEFGGAGEFGHIVIQREGSLCYCGQRGCLEMYASDEYICSEGIRQVSLGLSTNLIEYDSITSETIYLAADQGDLVAQDILFKQGENLGIGLKNMVNLLNPGAIILGGEGIRGKKYLLKGVQKELSTHFFTKHHKRLNIHVSELEEEVWLIGACALVANDLFKAPIYR